MSKYLSNWKTVRDNVVPGVAGVGVAQVRDGEGEGWADQVESVHQGQGQQQPEYIRSNIYLLSY